MEVRPPPRAPQPSLERGSQLERLHVGVACQAFLWRAREMETDILTRFAVT